MITVSAPASSAIPGTLAPTANADHAAFRNFATVWAIATLFHMAHSAIFDTRLHLALLTLAALYVVFRPTLRGFLVLILLQLLDVAFQMPNATNHWVFTAFVNLTILHAVLFCIYRKKSFQVDESEVYDAFAPAARIEVLILYGWAIFHKLNSDFFSPEGSCAKALLEAQQLDSIIAAFPQILAINPYFTIVVELAILVMLCFHRTRHAAILIGLIFHLVLSYSSYNAFFDFTSVVFAAYLLFGSRQFHQRAFEWRRQLRQTFRSFFKSYSLPRLVAVCIGIVALIAIIAILNMKLHSFQEFHLYFFWTLYAIVLTYVLVRFLFVRRPAADQPMFALRTRWFLVVPVILFLNGTSPYLGLKTENSYSMFSNLRTEGGVTNHYIVPASTQIFPYQSNMIEIVSSTDKRLEFNADQGMLMVLFEFKRYLQKNRVEEVVYRLNGEQRVYRHGETKMTGALKPEPKLLLWLMKFRDVSKTGSQPCSH